MSELDNRPDLPDIIPQDEITVEGEVHRFEVSQTDSGTQAQYEYTLDKAPVEEVISIQGTDQNGEARTFNRGIDYELTSRTNQINSDFAYDPTEPFYLVKYRVDDNTDSITDESGNTYTNGTDYRIIKTEDYYGDKLEWFDGGDSPEPNETFTLSYDVTFPTSVIQWQTDADNLPSPGTEFYVTYRADSVISRYLDAHESELDNVEQALQEVINNKFIDSASGQELDELGKLFGPIIGKRRERNDTQYRIYLKSTVQSFISRGTVTGIKLAISAATEVPLKDITINEDFDNTEYGVEVQAATPVKVDLLEDVADIADPSGVGQARTRFVVDPDVLGSDDVVTIDNGEQISDSMRADDTTVVNPNKFAITDEMSADDLGGSGDRGATSDTIGLDETVTTIVTATGWNTDNWGSLNWAKEQN